MIILLNSTGTDPCKSPQIALGLTQATATVSSGNTMRTGFFA
jgi:hypothetical protein